MDVGILTPKALFQKEVRYEIPTFQRPYVWSQEDQWEPLWTDVRNVAERYLDHLKALGPGHESEAERKAGAHFLGAIVVQQQPRPSSRIESRAVIDGQQRLTTLQLLLDAAQEVLERQGHDWPARRLQRLVLNDELYAKGDRDDLFKVWPTLYDRDAFRAAMTNGLAVGEFEESLIVQAHEFFQLQAEEWLTDAIAADGEMRPEALEAALTGLLNIVVIDLAEGDDPSVIFETLNARGTPLLDSDLIKNYLLHAAGPDHQDALHRQYWSDFDTRWWRQEVRQGRLVRPRIDVFLNQWLLMRTSREVSSSDVFRAFQAHTQAAQLTSAQAMAELQADGRVFRSLEELEGSTPEGTFMYRWRTMDVGVGTPVLMWLFRRREEVGIDSLLRSLRALESYFVRRMVCRLTTKDYNRLMVELMGKLTAAGSASPDEVIREYLGSQPSDSRLWPDDALFEHAIVSLPLYRLLTRGRLRMILEGLEDQLRSPKTEGVVSKNTLTIEHLLPQSWRESWPLELPDGEEAAEAAHRRDLLLHSLGNLTLATRKLNPSMSNAPWADKRAALNEHTVLQLSKPLLNLAQWDEQAILARGHELAEVAINLWPGPDGLALGS